MRKLLFIILCVCFGWSALCAAETESNTAAEPIDNARVASDYEQQVREMAERTAAEARAKKEQERLVVKGKGEGKEASQPGFKFYKYHKNGAVVFSDTAPLKTQYQVIVYNSCYACSLTSKVDWYNTKLYLTEFSDLITRAASQYRVDPAFIRAVIHAESAFNPLARSQKGAMGLMQLMPDTAKDMGVGDTANPAQNIQGGVKYLAYLLQTFSGNQILAAAAYNAGPKAVTNHGGIPPYEETQTYVKRVKILYERYKSQKVLASN